MNDNLATPLPIQQELPLAIVKGTAVMEMPADLYIPPEALEVFLETFEGPLDLLLYLIKKQNIDIVDIPIARISKQYVQYIDSMQAMQFELAAEYLVMAAVLAEIKSRILLPKIHEAEDDEHDPRAELIRRLQEYEQFKIAAQDLDQLPRLNRDNFLISPEKCPTTQINYPEVHLADLMEALQGILKRADNLTQHEIKKETLSIREKMSSILTLLKEHSDSHSATDYIQFPHLFDPLEGRRGIVITFMAVLELSKQMLIEIMQNTSFSTIHIKAM